MPAHKVVSTGQLQILLNFMEEHEDLATGRILNIGPQARQAVKSLWEELARRLNSVGVGTTKTAVQWRKYWNEKKYLVKKKALDAASHARGTGGGPPKRITLMEEEERIYTLIGRLAVHGEESVMIPFNDENEQSVEFPVEQLHVESPIPPSVPASPEEPEAQQPEASSTSSNQYTAPVFSLPSGYEETQGEQGRRRYQRRLTEPPTWAAEIEERRVAATEMLATCVQQLTSAVGDMQNSIRTLTEEVAAIRITLEARTSP